MDPKVNRIDPKQTVVIAAHSFCEVFGKDQLQEKEYGQRQNVVMNETGN